MYVYHVGRNLDKLTLTLKNFPGPLWTSCVHRHRNWGRRPLPSSSVSMPLCACLAAPSRGEQKPRQQAGVLALLQLEEKLVQHPHSFVVFCRYPLSRVSLGAQMIKNPPAMQETWVRSLGREDPLEKGMVTHSSILAWRSPWTEEPSGLQSMGR